MRRVLKVNPWAGASNTLMDQSKAPGRNLSVYFYKNKPIDWSILMRGCITSTVKTWMQRRPNKHAQNLNSNGLLGHAVWPEHFQLLFGRGHKGGPAISFGGVLYAKHWGTQGLRVPCDTTMLPGEHSDCFHFSEEKTEAKPYQVTYPRSQSCPSGICTHVYLPLDSKLRATVSHHEGCRLVKPAPPIQSF